MANLTSSLPGDAALLTPITRSKEVAIYAKINWRIIPIILFAYILAFLDQINVGYSATGIAVISSIGVLGGFVSPTLIGFIKDWTGSISGGLALMTVLIVAGGLTILIGVPAKALRVGTDLVEAAH